MQLGAKNTCVHDTQGEKQAEELTVCMHKVLGKCCCGHVADSSLDPQNYSVVQLSTKFFGGFPKSKLTSLSNL